MYCLEMRSTADWNDCRYRAYTSSAKKAETFKRVPKVQFSDSGHGIVPTVTEVTGRSRGTEVHTIADYVREAMQDQRPIKMPGPGKAERAANKMADTIRAQEQRIADLEAMLRQLCNDLDAEFGRARVDANWPKLGELLQEP